MLTASHAVCFFNSESELLKIQEKLQAVTRNLSVEWKHNCYLFESEKEETGYKNRSEAFIKLHDEAQYHQYVYLTKKLREALEEGETEESQVLVDCFFKDEHIC